MIVSSALGILIAASPVMADSRNPLQRLRGDFAFSGTGVCVNAQNFTGPTPYWQTLDPFRISSFSTEGVYTFNGDGTGSVTARQVWIVPFNPGSNGPVAVSTADAGTTFTYYIDADGRFTIDLDDTPRTQNIPAFAGHLSADGNSMTFASYEPGVEQSIRRPPNADPVVNNRMCHRAMTGIRIGRSAGSRGQGDD